GPVAESGETGAGGRPGGVAPAAGSTWRDALGRPAGGRGGAGRRASVVAFPRLIPRCADPPGRGGAGERGPGELAATVGGRWPGRVGNGRHRGPRLRRRPEGRPAG